MSPLDFAIELELKKLKCPHFFDEYGLKQKFLYVLHHYIRHSTRSYWSSHRSALFQKLVYHTTSLSDLQTILCPGKHPDKHTIHLSTWNKRHWNCLQGTVTNIRYSSIEPLRRSKSGSRMKVPAEDDASSAPLNCLITTFITTEFNDTDERARYGRVIYFQLYEASRCPLSPMNLVVRFTGNRTRNSKTIERHRGSEQKPKCGRLSIIDRK